MRRYSLSRPFTWLLLAVWLSASGFAQKPATKPAQRPPLPPSTPPMNPPSGMAFFIGPVGGAPGTFSILLGEGKTTITGTFSAKQIDVFESVLLAAKEFAQTDEAVGNNTPIITRLMDQHEWSLFVDVSKQGDRSRFYVTLITTTGKLTAEAGEIIRGNKQESKTLFADILSKVQEAKARLKPSR
jgi:hypothetical protein